jgi:hypothetical protein
MAGVIDPWAGICHGYIPGEEIVKPWVRAKRAWIASLPQRP